MGAALAAVRRGLAPEVDVALLADDAVVLFHDEDLERITGRPGSVAELALADVRALRTQRVIDGRRYPHREPIPSLDEVLAAVCAEVATTWVYLDVKTPTSPAVGPRTRRLIERTVAIWAASPCAARGHAIFGIGHPIAARHLAHRLDELDTDRALLQLYVHPGAYPLGEALWLANRLPLALSSPHMVGTRHDVWAAHPDVAAALDERGFCLTTYGGSESTYRALPVFDRLDVLNLDVPASHTHRGDGYRSDPGYTPGHGPRRALSVGLVVALGLVLVGAGRMGSRRRGRR